MSRKLASYERGANAEEDEKIVRIMEAEGCTAPVAKNLLRQAKLGMGKYAIWENYSRVKGGQLPSAMGPPQPAPPKTYDRKQKALQALEAEKRQRELEEREDEKVFNAFAAGSKKKVGGLAGEAERRLRQVEHQESKPGFEAFVGTKEKKVGGLARLGPVLAREEEVDPLFEESTFEERRRQAEEDRRRDEGRHERQMRRDAEARRSDRSRGQEEGSDVDYESLPARFPTEKEKRKVAERHQEQQEGRRRKKKRRRKRGRDWEDEDEDEDTAPRDRRTVKERSMSHSRSASSEPVLPSNGALMSEEQARKMVRHGKRSDGFRNPAQAKERIQKELEEYEAKKRENVEFWKAPKFCLVYAGETSTRLRR